jgi:hypothetical protein
VRVQRGILGRIGERFGFLGPKFRDGNAAWSGITEGGVDASVENAAAGAYAGSGSGGRPCH